MKETLQELTELFGPCGFEQDVVHYIVNRLEDQVDEWWVDGVGNLIMKKSGAQPGPRLIVSAHMDEVGFIVKKIEDNGLIRFEKLGGHDDRILLAQQVKVGTEKGIVNGVIGTLSVHMMKFEDPTKVRRHAELYIDVGVDSKAEAEQLGIQVGDPITWATEQKEMAKDRIIGKGFDDRAGCAVLLKAMEELDFNKVNGEVYAVFSVQEEVGLRGAKVVVQQIDADVALSIDTTAVSDTPEAPMGQTMFLGAGPCIKVMDFSFIANPSVRKKLVECAKESNLPYQMEVFPGIGTDSGELHLGKKGVPTGGISIPSRYTHSPIELIDLKDLMNTKELLKSFILNMRDSNEFSFYKKTINKRGM
ncbi:endoglucanase [Evansella vedderi]|uniref:Endoglucanase n=1 Tax=Evansella vedderi TaxID=38282 RepID=A0ABT9ZPQ8_9BACI|nr:M42 family metallopeptidase [Evansella vedderi]MDQ0252935.1 endoglucanase [Evansella vedderi]